ncbi:MAG: hypothetical protein HY355_07485 [Armatimonadetes bacterium]|nr:hypothetical protein [Armatimonadota bacterium]
MQEQVVARFLVDRPIRPGMVRAILDTLSAQGGAYEPHLMRRADNHALQRVAGARPARLLDEVSEGGTQTTFLRVSEALPQPVLSFAVSASPRTNPTRVVLSVPADSLQTSREIEGLLGVCKGLYLFLEAPWGTVGSGDLLATGVAAGEGEPAHLQWANFLGPEVVSRLGPARLLTSTAFIVEILPDGGVMLVTHPSPGLAESPEGKALRRELERSLEIDEGLARLTGVRAPARPQRGARSDACKGLPDR